LGGTLCKIGSPLLSFLLCSLCTPLQSRTDKKSTIYCSQWAPEGWLGKLGDGPLADAILDRIRNSSYTILLKGRFLREDYSKIK